MNIRAKSLTNIVFIPLLFAYVLFIARTFYSGYLIALRGLVEDELYGYLLLIIPLTIFFIAKLIAEKFALKGLSIERFLAFLIVFQLSLLLYIVSLTINEEILLIRSISFVMLIWGILILLFKPNNLLSSLILFILLAFLIPVPRGVIDAISVHLSRFAAITTSYLTGATLVEKNNVILLSTPDNHGVLREFNVAYVCSGIISLSAVLSLLPLNIYILYVSRSGNTRKLLALTLSIILGSSIVFLCNILRLALIVWITRIAGFESAVEFFHTLPSTFYSSLGVLASFYILYKFLLRENVPKGLDKDQGMKTINNHINYNVGVNYKIIGSILILLLLIPTYYYATGQYIVHESVKIPSLQTLISSIGKHVFNNKVRVLSETPTPALAALLGASIVKLVNLEYKNILFYGYVELAESPTRYHSWSVCLTFQGYKILRSWIGGGNITINYMLIEKKGVKSLLGYSVYKYPVVIGGEITYAYIRISVFKTLSKSITLDDAILLIKQILTNVREVRISGENIYNVLNTVMIILNITIIFTIGVIIVILLNKYRGKLFLLTMPW
jgi:exosortase/archaeosortase family protein